MTPKERAEAALKTLQRGRWAPYVVEAVAKAIEEAVAEETARLSEERDEFRASFLELFETTRRYRAALGHYADEKNWNQAWFRSVRGGARDWYVADPPDSNGWDAARAALAAPDAGGQAAEERT